MNTFIGVGKIRDMHSTGKILKFHFCILQKRACIIPCVIFNPDNENANYIQNLQNSERFVWLKGIISSKQYEYKGKRIQQIEIFTFASSIKPI